ncbi:uncharacterized protein BT62DRAFT_917107 [Guyanagaster necrorhizus]|uniref:Uncharacterized protein n=1 Tax=Guyanagaster necrorhizus TaxID=856835 RepID=A0A9P7W3U7_9AGAR|nr:uncharacterized protein BT62DRAFT_917107 [Guyanagaster necrorhizus MCA 3950]KAG7450806.1 hypothetical protein BT62DRAFT_917107 [Guyanagaster necrorhizus MCA 3950]
MPLNDRIPPPRLSTKWERDEQRLPETNLALQLEYFQRSQRRTESQKNVAITKIIEIIVEVEKRSLLFPSLRPEDWNTSWEHLCSSGILSHQLCLAIAFQVEKREPGPMAFEYSRKLQSTLGLRFYIGVGSVDALRNLDLEAKWITAIAIPAARRQHALVGLSEACAIAGNLNDVRGFTGDILPDNISVVPQAPRLNRDPQSDLYIRTKEGRRGTTVSRESTLLFLAYRALVCHYTVWFCPAKRLDQGHSWDFKAVIDQMAKEYESVIQLRNRSWVRCVYGVPSVVSCEAKVWFVWAAGTEPVAI